MVDSKRQKAILELIASYTAEHSVTATAARNALIREGIYDKNGRVKLQYRETAAKDKG